VTLLVLEGVRKRFRRGLQELTALADVSLELFDGDLFGVLGGARSGKTTLLRVAAGIEPPDAGHVRFLGQDLASMSRRQRQAMLRSDLGCVWRADRSLRRLPVGDHVALPLIADGRPRLQAVARAHELLRSVSAEDCMEALLSELSTSELVRVSIAQALVREPRLILADQPTDTLNMIERDEILAILRSAAAESRVGVLLTSGDATGLLRTNRLASLDEGRLLLPSSGSAEPPNAELLDLDDARRRARERP
jgi:ABC-type lipoprotein export system ATPase subunit